MMKIWSRKDVCEELNITMKTLCKKLKELNIECINEVLKNNVVSMKISHEDYLKIAESCKRVGNSPELINNDNQKDLVIHDIKMNLVKVQTQLDSTIKILEDKEKLILEKNEMIRKIEEKNDRLFDEFMELNKIVNRKGFFSRLFGK